MGAGLILTSQAGLIQGSTGSPQPLDKLAFPHLPGEPQKLKSTRVVSTSSSSKVTPLRVMFCSNQA